MAAYYNENDPFAAQWLRNLIKAGHIAPGDVDDRSILDVKPEDLRGYTQCHFFAGVGVWSRALRRANWPDDRPVWTGSCPCQPFSSAGKGEGFADERHLWPAWFHLIRVEKPVVIFGEQVASKDGLPWFDLIQADLEAESYAIGGAIFALRASVPRTSGNDFTLLLKGWVTPSARDWKDSPGMATERPDGRSRVDQLPRQAALTGWPTVTTIDNPQVAGEGKTIGTSRGTTLGGGSTAHRMAYSASTGQQRRRASETSNGRDTTRQQSERFCEINGMGHPSSEPGQRDTGSGLGEEAQSDSQRVEDGRSGIGHSDAGDVSGMEQPNGVGWERGQTTSPGYDDDRQAPERQESEHGVGLTGTHRLFGDGPGPTNGFWRDADWLFCRDGKWRPVRPGTFPLVNGAAQRVGRLRAYGNAINAELTQVFIEAYLEVEEDRRLGIVDLI